MKRNIGIFILLEYFTGKIYACLLYTSNILDKIITHGNIQCNKKGNIKYLLNEQLILTPADLLDIFEGHNIARKKLRNELTLFMQGEKNVEKYRNVGINWWDYCGQVLINSYPTYFEKLPSLITKINKEKRCSKNYVLFLGSTGLELSLIHIFIEYDRSGAVNGFIVNGISTWLTPDVRANYKNSIEAAELLGETHITFIVAGIVATSSLQEARIMLAKIQRYADRCTIVTETRCV